MVGEGSGVEMGCVRVGRAWVCVRVMCGVAVSVYEGFQAHVCTYSYQPDTVRGTLHAQSHFVLLQLWSVFYLPPRLHGHTG